MGSAGTSSTIVIGAGCFGAWTALHLAKSGRDVVLLDAHGPGNSRASSGGETRIIRMGYGAREVYTQWSWRSLAAWQQLFQTTDRALFRQTGVLWLAREDDPLTTATQQTLARLAIPHERYAQQQLAQRWPQLDFTSIPWGLHEPHSGVLLARRAVEAVAREAERVGVRIRRAAAQPPVGRGRLAAVTTTSGERVIGDSFVFAGGPWLPKLFPGLLAPRIFVTKQEVLYFGLPPGDLRFAPPALPAWIDFGEQFYGIPDLEGRGLKVALDQHGPAFDPDGERRALDTVAQVRAYLGRRFPALRDAPLLASEICQYENTSNGDFLIDRHPDFDNVWLAGGGSGHGFKHGPVVGEVVARLVVEGGDAEPWLRLPAKHVTQARTVF